MTPKLWGYVGIGIAVLALIGAVMWQANKLIKVGQELGEARAIQADLRAKLKDLRDADRAEWDKLRADLVECNERVDAAVTEGERWKTEWDRIRRRPPREVIVEVEATTWHESLIEGHGKFLDRLEGLRSEDTGPTPFG
jgi:hypothetical protein